MSDEIRSGLPVLVLADAPAFERWLAGSPNVAGAWLKFAKQGSGAVTLSKDAAIDSALCYGWIDGQLGRYDETYFVTRFTPRGARSRWSQINCVRAERLILAGRMRPAGLAHVEAAKADGRWEAAYPSAKSAPTPEDFRRALDASPKAAQAFERLDGANRYAFLYRLHHARDEAARAKTIARLVGMLEQGETFHPKTERDRAD